MRYQLNANIAVNDRPARTIDISSCGMFFESADSFAPGDEVSVLFPFEQSGPGTYVRCRAQVVRVEPRGATCGVAVTYEPVAFSLT